MLNQHNQETARMSPDPFPSLWVGSGDETSWHTVSHPHIRLLTMIVEEAIFRIRHSKVAIHPYMQVL